MLKFKSKLGHRVRSHRHRRTRQGCRSIEPEFQDLQTEEEMAPDSLREDVKKNNFTSAKALGEDILQSVGTGKHLHGHNKPLTSISMNLAESVAAPPVRHSKNAEMIKLGNNLKKALRTVDRSSNTVRNAWSKLCHASSNSGVENLTKPFSSHQHAYNKKMKSFSQVGEVDEVLKLFSRMKESRCNPNVLCYNTVLDCLVRVGHFEEVLVIFDEMIGAGIKPNVSTYNILVKSHCYLGDFDAAGQIFNIMSKKGHRPDVTTYSTLIAGLSRGGRVDNIHKLLDIMSKKDCYPNVYTYTSLIQGLCIQGKFEGVKRIEELMWKRGYPPNFVTYNILIDAHCKLGNFAAAELIFKESDSKGWQPNSTSHHIYVSSLCKARLIEKAHKHLEAWDACTFCYNTVMNSFCMIGHWFTCLKILSDMVKKGVVPNTKTYNIVVHSLCKVGKLKLAKCMVLSRDFFVDIVTYNTLINEFYEAGDLSEARNLFYRMTNMENFCPDLFTYTIFIKILCRQGKCSTAIHLFDEFLSKGLLPDLVMFSALITGCLKNGNFYRGLKLLYIMLDHGFIPDVGIVNSVLKGYCSEGYCCRGNISHVCNTIEKMLGKGEVHI